MNDIISADTLFWTYSTIAQSLLALIAFLGTLTVFRLIILNSQFDDLYTLSKDAVIHLKRLDHWKPYSQKEILDALEEVSKLELNESKELSLVKLTKPRIDSLSNNIERIKRNLIVLSVFILSSVGISLINLPFVDVLKKSYISYALLSLVFLLAILALVQSLFLIISLIYGNSNH